MSASKAKKKGRYILSNDPAYPIDRYRRSGQITLFMDVIHDDPDGTALTEEVWAAVTRFLRAKGCDVDGGVSQYEATGLWIEDGD